MGLAFAPAARAQLWERTFSESHPVPGGVVALDVARGALEVVNGPADGRLEVVVVLRIQRNGEAGAGADEAGRSCSEPRFAPRVKTDERSTSVTVADSRQVVFDWDPSLQMAIDVRLSVPEGKSLEVRNVEAGVTLPEHFRGDVDLRSHSGSFFAGTVDGDLTARTQTGSITVKEVTGRSVLRSDTGLVLAGRLRGPAELRSSTGGVEVQHAFDKLKIRGDTADIFLGLSAPLPTLIDLATSTGEIALGVDDNVAFTADASTRFLGRVRMRGLEPQVRRGGPGNSSMLADFGGGGGPVAKLRTSGGAVSLVGRAPLEE